MKKIRLLVICVLLVNTNIIAQNNLNSKGEEKVNKYFLDIINIQGINLRDTISCCNELFINGDLYSSDDSIRIFRSSTIIIRGKDGYSLYEDASVRLNIENSTVDFFCKIVREMNESGNKKNISEGIHYYQCNFVSQIIITKTLANNRIYNKYKKKLEENEIVKF